MSASAKSPPAWHAWAVLVGMMLVGGLLAAFGARWALPAAEMREAKAAGRAAYGAAYGPLVALIAILTLWLVIALHEVGHLVGGVVARFRFELFIVGPLRVARDEHGRVRVGLNRDLAMAGGVASALPEDTVALRRRVTYLIAGGPLASILLSALGFWLVQRDVRYGPFAFFFSAMIALTSAGIALATLVPGRSGGMATDGLRLLRLARGGPSADRDAALLPLVALARTGMRPRDWPEHLVRSAESVADANVEECVARLFAYLHHLDHGRVPEAGRAIDRVLALAEGRYPKSYLPLLKLEGAYYAAFHRRDPTAARALMAGVPDRSPLVPAADHARSEAAILLAEGDRAGSAATARRGLAQAPVKSPFTRARLEEIVARAESTK